MTQGNVINKEAFSEAFYAGVDRATTPAIKVLKAYRDLKCCGNCQAYRYTPYGVSICQRRDKNANITDPGRCCEFWAADGITAVQRIKNAD